jgi:serine/threonine-protein kinase
MEPVTAPRTFSGRYEVTHLIARGGMAQVYRALDLRLGRHVALKVLFPELSVDRTFVERFRREAQAAANLSHPNVVAVYDWGEDEGTYFIVMELITGTSLATALRDEKTIAATRAASIAAQVASALSYAHRHGVVHRDIKPGNVMLTDDGQVKVTDFGIAQAVSTEEGLTMAGSVMGTAAYFSPEQAEGAVVDGRSDVYSLGIVLYEMLAGRTPYVGDSPVAVASMHVRNTPPLLRDLNPAVPADIEAVTMRALAKSPDDRYQSAEDFRSDLLRFTEGQPVVAESVTQTVGVGATSVIGAGTTGDLPVRDSTVVVPAVGPLETGVTAIADADEAILVAPVAIMDGPVRDVATNKGSSSQSMWLAAALVVALLVAGFFVWRGLSGPGKLAMPDVVGKPSGVAIKTLEDDGFRVTKSVSVRSRYPAQTVARTLPPAGTALKPGAIVTLFVSRGPQFPVKVPNVVGLQVAAAQTLLSGDKLVYKQTPVLSWTSSVIPGSVLHQSPAAGQTVLSNSPVTLTVLAARGTYPVPYVIGQLPGNAGATLATYGLTVRNTTSACTTTAIAAGNVVATSPGPGAPVTAGTPVDLTVSTGPCPVLVPNLSSLTPQQARQQILNAKLQPGVISTTCQTGYTSTGLIASQYPLALQAVPPGSPVSAQVGCTPPTTTTTSTTLPPGAGGHATHRHHPHGRSRRHHDATG